MRAKDTEQPVNEDIVAQSERDRLTDLPVAGEEASDTKAGAMVGPGGHVRVFDGYIGG